MTIDVSFFAILYQSMSSDPTQKHQDKISTTNQRRKTTTETLVIIFDQQNQKENRHSDDKS
jgi:hypothetical protein